jgi:nucleoside-diphosphate-sugar epimerase
MPKVLVIGASGSLGKEVSRLLSKSFDVYATYFQNKVIGRGVTYCFLNIQDAHSFDGLDDDYEAVVLVSGVMPASMKGYEPQKYIDVNITGVLNVLEFCRKNKINKIVYVMTFSDVSDKFYTGVPIRHDSPRRLILTGDHAIYAISKVAACDLIEHYHQEYGLQTIIFRIPTVYCADNNVNYYVDGIERTKAYVKMIRDVVNNKRVEIWGDPNSSKDMPYVKDFSRLICSAVKSETAQGLYNAGTGDPVSLEKFADALIAVFGEGEEIETVYKPEMPSQPNFTFDMSRTMKEFNYLPEYDVYSMFRDIKETVDPKVWVQKNI